jgi:3-oxoacyl-[acyl-carrier protein] reductase
VGFTESLDLEVRDKGISVYAVCPGRVATDMQVLYSGRKIGMAPEYVAEKLLALAEKTPRLKRGRCIPMP